MHKNIHHENYHGSFHNGNSEKLRSVIKINDYANYVNSIRKFVFLLWGSEDFWAFGISFMPNRIPQTICFAIYTCAQNC